ncbi:MAG: hypothetical protein EAX96_00760 [Candidatus Lokiarchaeota archaeon]|nr:hypothetical protein [Candidatus Lokiarchaeota archaeon]
MQSEITNFFMYLALILAFILVIVKMIISGYTFKTYRENREHKLLIPIAILFLMFGMSRILLIYFDFYLTGFNDDLFQTYSLIWKIAIAFQSVGYSFMIFVAEKEVFKEKTKFIISISNAVFLIAIYLVPDIVMFQTLITISLSIVLLIIPICYGYLARATIGVARKKALSIFIGFFINMFGTIMLLELFVDAGVANFRIDEYTFRYILYSISMVIRMVGLSLIGYGYTA